MVMNPASSTLYNFVSETIYGPSQKENLQNLTKELDYKMKENSIEQLSDLYKKLAIRYVLMYYRYTFSIKSQHSLKFIYPLFLGFRPFNRNILIKSIY